MIAHHRVGRAGRSAVFGTILIAMAIWPRCVDAQGTRVDRGPGGEPANGRSLYPVVSFDGRYVAFLSGASNLVEGDTDNSYDFFRYDRGTGQMVRGDAVPFIGGGFTIPPPFVAAISQDGRWLLFHDDRPDWVPGDTNHDFDSFQYDFATGAVRRVTVGSGGVQANGTSRGLSMSADGRFVAFESTATNISPAGLLSGATSNIFVHDTLTGETAQVSRGAGNVAPNGSSTTAVMSPDGEWVAFTSAATNLTARPDTNGKLDVFVAHWPSGGMIRVRPSGVEADQDSFVGAVSAGARDVVFCSSASNLISGQTQAAPSPFVWERLSGRITYANPGHPLSTYDCSDFSLRTSISRRGTFVTLSASGLVQYSRSSTAPYVWPIDPVAAWHETSGPGDVVVFQRDDGIHAVRTGAMDGVRPGADEDRDGLPDTWEEQFGLHQFSPPQGEAAGDADLDGMSNLQELEAGTHPVGGERRYFAEGATGAFFETRFALFNPSTLPVFVQIRVSRDDGVTFGEALRLEPRSRSTVNASALAGVSAASFSTVIESDLAIIIERTMFWDHSGYGAHSETAIPAPSRTWYFAEGSTSGDFHLFYLLQNPQTNPVTVTVRFLRPFGLPPIEQDYTLPPVSRTTIDVDGVAPAVSSTDLSAVILASEPIVAERAMYLDRPGQLFAAGHAAAGVTEPSPVWHVAEGATGPFFELFILLMNPNDEAVACDVMYLTSTGVAYTKAYTLPPNSRTTIWVDDETIPGLGQVLRDESLSAIVTTPSGAPIVVERAMWWPEGDWQEAHASGGATRAGLEWAIADGEMGGQFNAQTFILLSNMSTEGISVVLTLIGEDGGSQSQNFVMRGTSRKTIDVGEMFPLARQWRFSAIMTASAPTLVVERATYWSPNGVLWAAGSSAPGVRLR